MPGEQSEGEMSVIICRLVTKQRDDLPDSCTIYDLHIARDTLSETPYEAILRTREPSTPPTSIKASIRFLMSIGTGKKRDASCRVASLTSSLCVTCFRAFMIRTMHAFMMHLVNSIWCEDQIMYARRSDIVAPLQRGPASPGALPRSRPVPRQC
jgi:hypothetical protein